MLVLSLPPPPPFQAHKLDAMEFFKKFAVQPDELPDTGAQEAGSGAVRAGRWRAEAGQGPAQAAGRVQLAAAECWEGPCVSLWTEVGARAPPLPPFSICLHRAGGVA